MIPKFRAWDKEKKIMDIVGGITFDGDEIWEISFPGDCWIDASNYILMQSTGLHDVNGKEIFEGDIVKNSYGEIGYIKHSIYTFVFAKKKECEWREFYLHGIGAGSPFEILGNIHENPELLEAN